MPFYLENKIIDVHRSSRAIVNCVEEGPFELRTIAPDVRYLSETIGLLADATAPSVALFEMATREQASELWSALEACDHSLSNIRHIWTSFAQLDEAEQRQFTEEARLSTGGLRHLQSKLVSYSTTLKNLLVDFKVSSTALNWPPNLDVLGTIQAELLAEGVQVDHLQDRRDEIKAYIRSLAIGEAGTSVCASQEAVCSCRAPPLSSAAWNSALAPASPSRCHVTDLANQFSSLFEPQALRRPSLDGAVIEGAVPQVISEKATVANMKQEQLLSYKHSVTPLRIRKDSMDPTAASLVSRLSNAMANMAFSVSLQNKPHSSRPPPQRSSSAVFRGLGNEERATVRKCNPLKITARQGISSLPNQASAASRTTWTLSGAACRCQFGLSQGVNTSSRKEGLGMAIASFRHWFGSFQQILSQRMQSAPRHDPITTLLYRDLRRDTRIELSIRAINRRIRNENQIWCAGRPVLEPRDETQTTRTVLGCSVFAVLTRVGAKILIGKDLCDFLADTSVGACDNVDLIKEQIKTFPVKSGTSFSVKAGEGGYIWVQILENGGFGGLGGLGITDDSAMFTGDLLSERSALLSTRYHSPLPSICFEKRMLLVFLSYGDTAWSQAWRIYYEWRDFKIAMARAARAVSIACTSLLRLQTVVTPEEINMIKIMLLCPIFLSREHLLYLSPMPSLQFETTDQIKILNDSMYLSKSRTNSIRTTSLSVQKSRSKVYLVDSTLDPVCADDHSHPWISIKRWMTCSSLPCTIQREQSRPKVL
ncbi:hypothetical protein KCU65_g410, partial [Aureobasidium melanogenum]